MEKRTKTTIYLTERQLIKIKQRAVAEGFGGNVSLFLRSIALTYKSGKPPLKLAKVKAL